MYTLSVSVGPVWIPNRTCQRKVPLNKIPALNPDRCSIFAARSPIAIAGRTHTKNSQSQTISSELFGFSAWISEHRLLYSLNKKKTLQPLESLETLNFSIFRAGQFKYIKKVFKTTQKKVELSKTKTKTNTDYDRHFEGSSWLWQRMRPPETSG